MDSFNEVTDLMINKLYKMANGQTQISMHSELSTATLDAIRKVIIITIDVGGGGEGIAIGSLCNM